MTVHHGGCSCGQLRYRSRGAPMFTLACHCHLYKQSTGSAFILHSMIEGDLFDVTAGDLAGFVGPSGSGRRHIVKRCPLCGDPMVSYFGKSEKLAVVKTGTLDDLGALPPEAHIFVDSKLPRVTLNDGKPQFEALYDYEATWPADSYRRLMAVCVKP